MVIRKHHLIHLFDELKREFKTECVKVQMREKTTANINVIKLVNIRIFNFLYNFNYFYKMFEIYTSMLLSIF